MIIKGNKELRHVTGITPEQAHGIFNYLQGSVRTWCNKHPTEWFSLRDFAGGNNFNWTSTPLAALYEKHEKAGKSDQEAISAAGKDAGWLLKSVVMEDSRNFETEEQEMTRKYRWVK